LRRKTHGIIENPMIEVKNRKVPNILGTRERRNMTKEVKRRTIELRIIFRCFLAKVLIPTFFEEL